MKTKKHRLENRNGHWYEDGRMVRTKDLIWVYEACGKNYIKSGKTGRIYWMKQVVYI